MKNPYESPRHSKGRVNRAGERIGTEQEAAEDMVVLENWRAAHANILNTFKTILYNRARNVDGVQIAQRLKRRPTILDKLDREPGMLLSRMHDIAGCRVIFQSIQDLSNFRVDMHAGRFEHKRRGQDDRWNYIARPKDSGYRGIHDVYTYHVEPKKGRAGEDQPWNGMLVEIQYRTAVQHAWATAVELAGLITENNPKFDRGSEEFKQFFKLSSEILARHFERSNSCYPDMSSDQLISAFYELDFEIHLMALFQQMQSNDGMINPRNASILIFRYDPENYDEQLEVKTFDSMSSAVQEYGRLEKELGDQADIVLVGSRSPESIKSAYRNYFRDSSEFVALMESALQGLEDDVTKDGGTVGLTI